MHQWEGAVKEAKFPHTKKSLHGQSLQVAEWGNFRTTEESTATGVQKEKRRDSCTEDLCRPALTSPIGLSAHPLGRVRAGS